MEDQTKDLLTIEFDYKPFSNVYTEIVYPFGNYMAANFA